MARILVVDDDVAVRQVARLMLEAHGFQVAEVSDGVEAVRVFGREHADLILCDVLMPRKDGLQTIRELRALHPEVRVIAMTGGGRNVDLLGTARDFGAVEVLRKPFDAAAIVGAVGRALRSQSPAGSCEGRSLTADA